MGRKRYECRCGRSPLTIKRRSPCTEKGEVTAIGCTGSEWVCTLHDKRWAEHTIAAVQANDSPRRAIFHHHMRAEWTWPSSEVTSGRFDERPLVPN